MSQSAYKVLELEEGATQKEVKSAFRKLILKHHPDKNNNSEESTKRFIEIKAAYDIIIDELDGKKLNNSTMQDDNKDHFNGYWRNYFASKEYRKFKEKFAADLKAKLFMGYTIESYSLLENGEYFTTKAKTTYIAVRDCSSLEEIGIFNKLKAITNEHLLAQNDIIKQLEKDKLSQDIEEALLNQASGNSNEPNLRDLFYRLNDLTSDGMREFGKIPGEELLAALRGAVASQNLDKFYEIAEYLGSNKIYYNVGGEVISNVLEEILFEATYSQIDETKLLSMIKYLSEDKNFTSDKSLIYYATEYEFFSVAQYLFDRGDVPKNLLSAFHLFDYKGEKDSFRSFKWLQDHGAKLKKDIVAEVVCNKNLKYFKVQALQNEANLELAKKFLIEEKITTIGEVEALEQEGCNFVVSLEDVFSDKEHILMEAIYSGKTSNVKFVLDSDAPIYGSALQPLCSSSEEMVNFVLQQIDNIGELPKYSSWNYNEYFQKGTECLLKRAVESNSIENVKILLDKNIPLYTNTHLALKQTTPEIAELVLNQMRSQELKTSISHCSGFRCNGYNYNLSTPQECEVSKLVADYLGQTEQIDWSTC